MTVNVKVAQATLKPPFSPRGRKEFREPASEGANVPISKREETSRVDLIVGGLEYLAQGFSIFDRELRLVTCNRRFLELLGFPKEMGSIGRPLADFFSFQRRARRLRSGRYRRTGQGAYRPGEQGRGALLRARATEWHGARSARHPLAGWRLRHYL
ncbi:PAS domain-containing protein [Candidatus Accumulibacter phosphatis]|uniref:PAS domain-containing protein n=1 Tax=Candidatus Accumulibacter phosphatis TaxID=327160 RepID=A0ABX1TVU8_9PROT|nr:PAS domain-containing protein [Candidatus Accumulibacter phosphatis]